MNAGAPIEAAPRRVRPPYDVPDDSFEHLAVSNPDAWRVARRLDKLAGLCEPLAGLDITEYERRILTHLAGADVPEVAVIVALLHRARAAAPLDGEAGR